MIEPSVMQLCERVREAGGRAFLVGGWVRDYLRGIQSADYDIEVYRLEPETLRALLRSIGPVNAVGEAFTVYKVRLKRMQNDEGAASQHASSFVVDVSLPRRESKVGRGHRGFEVTGDPLMSYEEAARRRDFTINAVMYDPLADEYVDPFGGREDIKNKILRAVDATTFVEDSLRVLRAMQFAARFEDTIAPETVQLCRTIDLSDLPSERIWAEVEKWLLKSRRPSIGLRAAYELGITEKLWPEIHALYGCPQEPEWHPEGDVFIHSALVIDEARKLIDDLPYPKRVAVMLGALCHDFGKPTTTAVVDGRIRSLGHEAAGIAPTEAFLERLKLNTLDGYDVREQVKALVAYHLTPARFFKSEAKGVKVSDGAFRRLAQRVEPELLYRVARADCLGRTGNFKPDAEEWFLEKVRGLNVAEHAPAPLLLGRHVLALGLQPGPRVGQVTKAVYEMQLDGAVTTVDEAIEAAKRLLKTEDGASE